MSSYIRALRIGRVGRALLAAFTGVTRAGAQSVTSEETVRPVPRMLERLPYYGVFDFIVFRVKNGRTMLLGVVDTAADRQLAEVCAREVTGIVEMENSLAVAR